MPDSIATSIAPPAAPPPAAPPIAPAASAPPPVAAPAPITSTPSAPVNDGTAVPTGPQPPTPPNPKDIANASDWYAADTTYQQELAKFKEENPGVEIPEVKAAETPVEVAPETQETPQEAAKTEEGDTFSLEDETSLTPQALNDLIKGKPEREAFLNADPELKNALFKMSREHAELSQFRGIFPTKESATFAKAEADRKVQLTAKFQGAETPEQMASAFDDFMQEFAVVGPDGKQVVDESGQPVYGDDLYALGEHIVDRYADSTLADVEARIAANQYASEADRVRDQDMKIALQILKDDLHPSDAKTDPDLSGVPENLRAGIQARLDEAKAIEARNSAREAGQGKQAQKAARTQANTDYFSQVGQRTYEQVNTTLDAIRKAGGLVPEWQLKTTVPGTNIPAFYHEIGKEIETLLRSDPFTWKTVMQLEAAPPTPENLKARVQYYDSVLQRTDEKGVTNIRAIVKKLVRGFGKQVSDQAAAVPEPKTTAAPEPKGGGAPGPKIMTRDDAYKQAAVQLSKEMPGWDDLDPSTRMAYTMTRQNQLLTAKR